MLSLIFKLTRFHPHTYHQVHFYPFFEVIFTHCIIMTMQWQDCATLISENLFKTLKMRLFARLYRFESQLLNFSNCQPGQFLKFWPKSQPQPLATRLLIRKTCIIKAQLWWVMSSVPKFWIIVLPLLNKSYLEFWHA